MQSNSELIDNLVEKVSALFSSATENSSLKQDLQRNLRAIIQSNLSSVDMVSRDEFDAQVAVLHRSREKIEELEQELARLAEKINN